MKKVILYLLAINIFLCYGGVCDLCHSIAEEQDTTADCHSMGQMESESVESDKAIIPIDKDLISANEGDSLCQYFLPTKSFKITKDISTELVLTSLNYSEQNNYKYVFNKYNLRIPDKTSSPELFIKNSSFLI
ncbi:MAG: hypothetical protein GWO07_14550 [Candidatus Dadabacteria bacterium]|nr:hypothetical protein [Candidatus Dadabacteria bacterium]NIS09932.1 hypothetical protein [Candidatus Dadabacteria bacterium]NIV41820.1 hypothetical protein [Candidatus Dadabacteria bacterium]NIX16351.1 hypothetical protein [Candidatus Dadabacteria bacterium]NIY21400.1 hypothetical protein [Candidatus Dadabacteria bacterium]